jgi:NADPH:quinone reductase-like Zn-dependent oxidoreductase
MYAVTLTGFGGPEVMGWTRVPDLHPGPDQVLIDVVAAGVNRADLFQRQGFYPATAGSQ